ncbi:hypothetical protein FHR83_006643 [Actinoplanes campanulatus]|uniref:Uncharacterized protein n=1 Tax=Actinoplanes campanulatus TaxID=113559 RepID=A0A7W5FHY6_9ACTN|nr:hypothetical protein [Actinoplanes campanulatus]MBB3098937.1 hypothetical protein [Actinoplanes campanulatus]GGN39777.1 hypothetical protein GCM10010109_68130 [Actinoplanes campanulatus]
MSDQTIPRTWLAGDGAGVILACNGNCPDTPAGDLVVAEYGETATSRPEIRKFPLGDLAEFLAFADTHAYNCTPPEELDADAPHWGPLRACLPADQLDGWMWMARSTYNGVIVEHYKHHETRGGITLDHEGRYWSSRIIKHACSPWCDEPHEHDMYTDVREYFTVTEHEAFKDAGLWPWSLHDKAHPAPEWLTR